MIHLCFISGIYIIYYSCSNNEEHKDILYTGTLIWAFFISKFILLMVSVGAILLLSTILLSKYNNKEEYIIAIIAMLIIVIQTFFFDFLIWNGIINYTG